MPRKSLITGCTIIDLVFSLARHLLTALMYQYNALLSKGVLDGVWSLCMQTAMTQMRMSKKSLMRLIRCPPVAVLMSGTTFTNATSFAPRLAITFSKMTAALFNLNVMANVMTPGPPNPCVGSVNKLFTVLYKG